MGGEVIEEGKDVLLYLDGRRSYLLQVKRGERFHTHKGIVDVGELIGRSYGARVRSSLGVEFSALRPTIRDYALKAARRTQVIYPKDMALILIYTGIGPGSRLVEAGTGSGALTSLLAHYVRPDGRVYSYEVRKEFIDTAWRNIKRAGVADVVEIHEGDVTQSIEEREVDAVVLDVATPWLVVPHAYEALKGSAPIASFSPTVDQAVKTVEALRQRPFTDIETLECITRRYQVEPGRTRPETLTIAHTGYLTFARKLTP